MKLVTKDFILHEEAYIAYQLLELVYRRYASKLPEKSLYHLQQLMHYLIEDLEKEYPKEYDDMDITDSKIIERIIFNEETLKELHNKRKG